MSADRSWVENEYLPSLQGRVLYVGVNYYTQHYHTLIKSGVFESLDSCPERSKYGNTNDAHHNTTILDFKPKGLYDHISIHGCHGYEGYNIDNTRITEEIGNLSNLVTPGGTLQFGPGCNYITLYNTAYWTQFVKEVPFCNYNIIFNESVLPNYIWWGRKK